jgi:hypothetical protein
MSMSSRRAGVALFVAALTAVVGIGLASAGDASDASKCTLAPLTLPLWDATPAAVIAETPVASTAVEITEAEIEAAVAVIVACINTGEPVSIHAIYTDRYLAEQFADPTVTYLPEFEQSLALNEPQVTDQFTLEDVSDITPLDDGRVSVTIALSNGVSTFNDTLTLAYQDGTWLVDGVSNLDPPV